MRNNCISHNTLTYTLPDFIKRNKSWKIKRDFMNSFYPKNRNECSSTKFNESSMTLVKKMWRNNDYSIDFLINNCFHWRLEEIISTKVVLIFSHWNVLKSEEQFDLEEDQQTFVFFLSKNFFFFQIDFFSLKKLKEAKLDKQFPDEVNRPMDIPARVRFQKYFNWSLCLDDRLFFVDIVVWRVFEQRNGMSKKIFPLIMEEFINFRIFDRWSNKFNWKKKII